ncbi:RNA polymerase sigma factor [Actinomadura sp. HBU206391]|uniref:RNA polymerase sigma factor n=1 Tax=Actinomadura sp. HBU206391 TaxID=2731692 RepID=UPI00164FDBC4|nr:sigma-70 family RNA polymerase sigma factor [Actinomadura sp. HBU206391]MBC6460952.1 sigma-70 family RNA polymerase sigma factor [Actinomadura sp. HBU206391]
MGPPDPQQRFEALYTAQYQSVLSYVRRRTASPDDAADAIAEIFTTAWRRPDNVPACGRPTPNPPPRRRTSPARSREAETPALCSSRERNPRYRRAVGPLVVALAVHHALPWNDPHGRPVPTPPPGGRPSP